MYRLLAIAKYEHRYVIPSSAGSDAHRLDALATGCSLDSDGGPGMTAFDVMDDKFHLTQQPADGNGVAAPADKERRINLLNWDGKSTNGLFAATPHTNGAGNGAADEAATELGSAAEPTR
jgi:nitrate reductase beta subunit